MRWASAIGVDAEPVAAARTALARLRDSLGDSADLVLAFGSAPGFEEQLGIVRRELPGALALGCSAAGIVGGGREIEGATTPSERCPE